MTIKDLVELLQKEDQTKEVCLSSDPEGNSFSTVDPQFGESKMSSNDDNSVHDCLVIYPTGAWYDMLDSEEE